MTLFWQKNSAGVLIKTANLWYWSRMPNAICHIIKSFKTRDVHTSPRYRIATTLLKNVALVAKFFQIWSDKCLMDFNYLKGQTNQPREIWTSELGVKWYASSIASCYYVRRVKWSEKWHVLCFVCLYLGQNSKNMIFFEFFTYSLSFFSFLWKLNISCKK